MQPLLSKATLMVIANPFASPLDANGNPCTFVQYDPEHAGGTVRHIGCVLDRKVTKPRVMTASRAREDRRQYARVETTVRYDIAPVGIVHSAYHQNMIRDGALIAADETTWKRCGMKEPFAKPEAIIERDKAARIAEWKSANPLDELDMKAWPVLDKPSGKIAATSGGVK